MKQRFLVQHEPCECKCELNESVCNSRQKWNHNECRSECKELDNWGFCEKGYMWILVRMTASVIKHVKLMNIYILKIALVKHVWLVN